MEKTTKKPKPITCNLQETAVIPEGQPTLNTDIEDYRQNHARQWSTYNDNSYYPTGKTVKKLTPGFYEIYRSDSGIYFDRVSIKTEGLIRFPDSKIDETIIEIQKFWTKKKTFYDFGLTFKRGYIFYGPPGGGKTSTIMFICKDVIDNGGIVIKLQDITLFTMGMRKFREIQPNEPIVVLMEDIDSILEYNNESALINILDGLEQLDNILFLATTNYPEKLGTRIMNRPSRFDKKIHVGMPKENDRRLYIEHLVSKHNIDIDINQWVKDTKDFTIAHIKELFIAVIALDNNYDETIKTLKTMKMRPTPDEEKQKMGFVRYDEYNYD